MVTDRQVLMQYDQSVRPCVRMELKLVNMLLARFKARRWRVTIDEYEGEKVTDVKDALFNLDIGTVRVYSRTGDYLGFVQLVFGNGYDLVSDYSTALEKELKPVFELSERLADGLE